MSKILIASHVPGRTRIRGRSLKGKKFSQSICHELMDWNGVVTVAANRTAGSILIRYDRCKISFEEMAAALVNRFPTENTAEAGREMSNIPAGALSYEGDLSNVVSSAEREGRKKSKIDTIARDLNRPAKIALLFTMLAMIPALRVSTSLHAAIGFAHLAFLLPHLVMHRKKMTR